MGGNAAVGVGSSSSNTCSGPCAAQVVYSVTGSALNGGMSIGFTSGGMTGNLDGNPALVSASNTFATTPGPWDLRIYNTSPALHAGSTTSAPQYDLFGRAYLAASPSIGGIERQLYSNGWTQLANTAMTSICPSPSPGGSSTCAAIMDAWGGGTIDSKRDRLMMWGAGHTDYYGNQVVALNLNASPATLVNLTTPSVANTSGCSDTQSSDGLPTARHSYGGLTYLPNQDAMFTTGAGVAPTGQQTCTGFMANFSFSLSSNTWTNLAYQSTSSAAEDDGPAFQYDPQTAKVIGVIPGPFKFSTYDPVMDTWTAGSSSPGGINPGVNSTAGINPDQRIILFVGDALNYSSLRLLAYKIDTPSSSTDWTSGSTGCSAMNVAAPRVSYAQPRGTWMLFPQFRELGVRI